MKISNGNKNNSNLTTPITTPINRAVGVEVQHMALTKEMPSAQHGGKPVFTATNRTISQMYVNEK